MKINLILYSLTILIVTYVLQSWTLASYLLPFSLIPFFFQANKLKTLRSVLLHGVFLQLLFAYNTMVWAPIPLQTLLNKSEIFSWGAFLFLSPLVTLFLLPYIVLRSWLQKRDLPIVLFSMLSASLYYFLDKNFVFLDVSYAYYLNQVPELLSFAKVGGGFFLVFLIVFVSELAADLLQKKRYLLFLAPGCLFILSSMIYSSINNSKEGKELELDMVLGQTNYSSEKLFNIFKKGKGERELDHYEKLISYIEGNKNDYQGRMLILPESYFPAYYIRPDDSATMRLKEKLHNLIDANNISLLIGAMLEDEKKHFNVAVFRTEKSNYIYKKNFLMPFGEAIPGAEFFPFLYTFFYKPYVNSAGENLSQFKYKDASFSTLICSEIFSTALFEKINQLDIDFIVHLGNESWLRNSSAKRIVAMIAQVRAVELNIPIVKLSNTGLSGVTSATGKPLLKIEPNKEIFKKINVMINKGDRSFYAKHFFWVDLMLDAFATLSIILSLFMVKKKVTNDYY